MSIHAEAQKVETLLYGGKGRTADDGTWYGSGQRALQLAAGNTCGRAGKTARDRASGATARRYANRQERSSGGSTRKSR